LILIRENSRVSLELSKVAADAVRRLRDSFVDSFVRSINILSFYRTHCFCY